MHIWLRAIRLHQWVKNLLLFLPALAAHSAGGAAWSMALLGFAAFCAGASSAYIVNDLFDLKADRRHASKRWRPIAAGRFPRQHAKVLAAGLLIIACLLALVVGPLFLLVLLVYLAATWVYSGFLKRVVLLDVALLGGFYVLRVVGGATASGVPLSAWLVAFCFTFFFAVATVKRQTELTRSHNETEKIRGRGYQPGRSGWLMALGVLAAGVTGAILIAYGFSPSAAALYARPTFFSWVAVPVGIWLARALYEGWHGRVDDDPVVYALKSRFSYLVMAAVIVIVAAAF